IAAFLLWKCDLDGQSTIGDVVGTNGSTHALDRLRGDGQPQAAAQMLLPGSKEVQRPAAVVERTIDSAYTAVPGRGESLRLVNAVRSLHQLAVRRLFF